MIIKHLKGGTVNILKSAAVIAVSVVALAACKPAAVDTTADEATIRASAPAWATAFNAGDADAIAAFYAEDGVLQPPNAPAVAGRDAIRAFMADFIEGAKAAGQTVNIPASEAIGVSGDMAYDAGAFTVTDASGATVDTGKFLAVYKKKDGKWLYVRDIWNSDMPAAPAMPTGEAATQ